MKRTVYLIPLLLVLLLQGCTSTGHRGRSEPSISLKTEGIEKIALDTDSNELGVAVEELLNEWGVDYEIPFMPEVREKVGNREYAYSEFGGRYLLIVRSTDLDKCVPEGSRQMHFSISVVDYEIRKRVFFLSGNYGCKDTIMENFKAWLIEQLVIASESKSKIRDV